jgi:glutamyl-tRNA synthetase
MLRDRGKTLVELADQTLFLVRARPLELDGKTHDLLKDAETRARVARLRPALAGHADWTPAGLESMLKGFAESEGVGLGKIGPGLRGILSGGAVAPDLASCLTALGRDESLGRLQDALFKA